MAGHASSSPSLSNTLGPATCPATCPLPDGPHHALAPPPEQTCPRPVPVPSGALAPQSFSKRQGGRPTGLPHPTFSCDLPAMYLSLPASRPPSGLQPHQLAGSSAHMPGASVPGIWILPNGASWGRCALSYASSLPCQGPTGVLVSSCPPLTWSACGGAHTATLTTAFAAPETAPGT